MHNGHGPHGDNQEKAKDFKSAIIRLVKELSSFKYIVVLCLLLAAFSSVLSILAPNRLSKLTDEISLGIVIDSKAAMELQNKIIMSNRVEDFVFNGEKITVDDQIRFTDIMTSIKSKEEYASKIKDVPRSIQKALSPKMNLTKIKNISLSLFSLYFLSSIFTFIQGFLMTGVSNNFAKKLRGNINNKINRLPLKYFDKTQKGDVLSRITNDVDLISQSMNQSLASLISSLVLFVGTLIMMFITNYVMALTALIASLFGFVFMFLILKRSQKYFVKRQTELGKLNGHIEEIYSGLNIVKVYNGKKLADKTFDEFNNSVYEANRKSQFLSGLMMPIMGFTGNLSYVAVCIVGAMLTMNGNISFGVIVAFMTYVRMFTSPLSQIAQGMTSMQSVAAASERVFEIFDEEEMSDESAKDIYLNKSEVKGKIEFKNVSFKYDGNEKDTIKHFSALAYPGQKIAIVGPTGAGKTTIVNLLMRFYDITDGDILIDDVSTKKLTRENIHDLFTMVLQDTWLFDGTVKDNLIFNGEEKTLGEIKDICKVVGVDHFIKTLPKSYDSLISDNDNISAGQKQLITIARGMIKNSPFLILDEATSNVDTRTEELVQSAMDKLADGKTSFIIAHRLSTIKNADLILVMNDGNIIEQGTHDELLKKKGFYADLYNSQFSQN